MGGDTWEASLVGPDKCSVRVKDNGDGTYTGTYQTGIRGIFQLYVSLGGVEIPDSPYEIISEKKLRRKWIRAKGTMMGKAMAEQAEDMDEIGSDYGEEAGVAMDDLTLG